MDHIGTILTTAVTAYALGTGIFLISENRRPQATLAWMLAFLFAPGVGVLAYFLFGRPRKWFSRESKLLRQDLEGHLVPVLSRIRSGQDGTIARLAGGEASQRKLMMLVRRNSRSALTTRNRVEILQDAAAFYPRLIEDMKAARHSIHLQYFIWRADSFTAELKEVLAERAAAGVEVRLLYDALGSRVGLSRRYLAEMTSAGIQMVPTSPLYRLHTIGYRNHRKITVIDGRIGYTGGMNIGQEHIDGGRGYASWRDTQLRIVGDGAALLQSVFMVDWYNAARQDLFSERYFPAGAVAPGGEGLPVQILTSGPDSEWAAIRQLYFAMIAMAQRHVFLQSPYFILDATIAEALSTAALAGVEVKVMLSAPGPSDVVAGWAANTFIADIEDAGVKVFLYEKGYLHAKTISIDSEICSVGSANMDIRSFSINYELNAVLYSERLAAELERDFERDLLHCRAFDGAEYRRHSAALRFRDSVARLLSPLL
ncbi:MAG: cardiolipin synthase [Alphaproteobacteria bacterium]|nr:MAG: cardiolipin synthase [Alphaproteobacteria bacterium]